MGQCTWQRTRNANEAPCKILVNRRQKDGPSLGHQEAYNSQVHVDLLQLSEHATSFNERLIWISNRQFELGCWAVVSVCEQARDLLCQSRASLKESLLAIDAGEDAKRPHDHSGMLQELTDSAVGTFVKRSKVQC